MAELTIDKALQRGIEAHKVGKVQEAEQYYTAILNVQSKHPDANHNMGVLAVGVGKVQESLSFFKTIILGTTSAHEPAYTRCGTSPVGCWLISQVKVTSLPVPVSAL